MRCIVIRDVSRLDVLAGALGNVLGFQDIPFSVCALAQRCKSTQDFSCVVVREREAQMTGVAFIDKHRAQMV